MGSSSEYHYLTFKTDIFTYDYTPFLYEAAINYNPLASALHFVTIPFNEIHSLLNLVRKSVHLSTCASPLPAAWW